MTSSTQTVLMCPPDHFEVTYVINPWMVGQFARTSGAIARAQWTALSDAIARHARVVLESPRPALPDIVFTANAGLVLGDKVIVSRFRSIERRGEEPYHRAWFAENGFEILDWPEDVPFEGAGDALFDRGDDILWVGHGFRSAASVPELLETMLGRKTAPLNLVDPRFYHLDTCFCPLEGGYLMFYPAAFDAKSQSLIEALVPADKRIEVDEADALRFCCNAVDLEKFIYMNEASETLRTKLRRLGFTPVIVPLGEFMKAGGAAKCLTLKLVER
jgi:N-dimethylarginine dimethylaminohydrolase